MMDYIEEAKYYLGQRGGDMRYEGQDKYLEFQTEMAAQIAIATELRRIAEALESIDGSMPID